MSALDELATSPGAHDIVFSDVVMPGMNGVELARQRATALSRSAGGADKRLQPRAR